MLKTINDGSKLDISVAEVVANAMKDWALENGCTHYTHWFQPMTGLTAEKHDSFIQPTDDRTVIMEFSGKSLLWVSRTRLLSHQADLEQHLRQEVIQLGTQHHLIH